MRWLAKPRVGLDALYLDLFIASEADRMLEMAEELEDISLVLRLQKYGN